MKIAELREQHIITNPPQAEIMRWFGMIVIYPPDATFVTQNEGEEIVIVLRKHIIRNFTWLVYVAIMLMIPAILSAAIIYVDSNFFQNDILSSDIIVGFNSNFVTVLLLFYYFFVASYAFLNFLRWYYDLFIITNERFISIDFDVLKGKTVTDIPLVDIVDIREKALGVIPTLLGYSTLEFKTVSELKMVIGSIPESTWFRDSFADLIKVVRQSETYETPKERDVDLGAFSENVNEISTQQQVNKNIEP